MGLTVVDRRTIGVDHLEEVHVAGTEGERGRRIEFRLDTHVVGGLHDVVDATLLSETYGDGVDTHGEGLLE